MTSTSNNQYQPDTVSPPGATLEELLDDRGMKQAELAKRTGRPTKTINEIIKGKAAITPETARQLELVLGAPADFWNQREKDYRAFLARQDEDRRLLEWVSWQQKFPVREMMNKGWLPEVPIKAQKVRALLSFFGVTSPEQWQRVHAEPQANFRKSKAFEADMHALAAWLARGARLAVDVGCAPFDKDRFRHVLADIRGLTLLTIEKAVPQLQSLCADCGVAVIFVEQVKNCRASGATRWLNKDKAIIQLSLRYKTGDHLWFTFFHEAGHILLHGRREVFVEGANDGDAKEMAADKFARDILIPPADARHLEKLAESSSDDIRTFAASIGIAPGIVIGRLQHDGLLPYQHRNDLKQKLQWAEPPHG